MKRLLFFAQRIHLSLLRNYSSLVVPCPEVVTSENPLKLRHFTAIHGFIGGNPERVKKLLMENMKLQLMDEKTILKKIDIVKGMHLIDNKANCLIQLLTYHSRLLTNRYEVFREYGIVQEKISSTLIRRYFSICKSTVSKLKKRGLIEEDHQVLKNLWQLAGLDMETYPGEDDDNTLADLKEMVLKFFLKDKIGIPDEMYSLYGRQIVFRLKNKSFATINANHEMFKNIIGLSRKRIQNNWFVLYYDPSNTLDLLNRVREVANVDMKIALHIFPKIAGMPSENAEKIVQYIEEENIPIHLAQRQLDIFTLNCETVRRRLHEAKQNEFFSLNLKNPRIIELLHFQVKAKKRLEILDELKLYATVSCLSRSEDYFEEFCEGGLRRFSYDITHYLTAELDITKEDFLAKVKRHHRWHYVPLVHVGRNLQKLRKHFSDEEIKKHLYVLFYYSEKLNRALEQLHSHEAVEYFKEKGTPESVYSLPLLLYILEKESDFSKESIWDQEVEVNPYQDLPDLPDKSKSLG